MGANIPEGTYTSPHSVLRRRAVMFALESYGYGQPASEAKLICESSRLNHGITTVTNPTFSHAGIVFMLQPQFP